MKYFLHFLVAALLIFLFKTSEAQTNAYSYQVRRHINVGGRGGWDYLTAYDGKLYIAHDSLVNVVDESSGNAVAIIPGTTGAHGIAFAPEAGKGFITAGKIRSVIVFDLKTNEETGRVKTAVGPDAIMYDSFSKRIFVCCGRANEATIIDPITERVTDSIALGGKPEEPTSDGAGNIYVNIEDKNEVVHIDAGTFKIIDRWKIGKGDGPSGLAMDRANKRLFIGCDKLTVIISSTDGKLVAEIPTGEGVDGIAFDPSTNCIFSPNGKDGTLTIIHEDTPDKYSVVKTLPTKEGARTITLDVKSHHLYLPTADFGETPPKTADNQHPRPKILPDTFQILEIWKY
jgi:DNA-binding beta-propeller fold protein YncE